MRGDVFGMLCTQYNDEKIIQLVKQAAIERTAERVRKEDEQKFEIERKKLEAEHKKFEAEHNATFDALTKRGWTPSELEELKKEASASLSNN
jgi:GGDEF domain-containing protein